MRIHSYKFIFLGILSSISHELEELSIQFEPKIIMGYCFVMVAVILPII